MNQGQLISLEGIMVGLFIVEYPEWSSILLRIMLVRDRTREKFIFVLSVLSISVIV